MTRVTVRLGPVARGVTQLFQAIHCTEVHAVAHHGEEADLPTAPIDGRGHPGDGRVVGRGNSQRRYVDDRQAVEHQQSARLRRRTTWRRRRPARQMGRAVLGQLAEVRPHRMGRDWVQEVRHVGVDASTSCAAGGRARAPSARPAPGLRGPAGA